MPASPVPARHWRTYGDDQLPSGKQALSEPFRAFPSWFLRITCDRCGKTTMLNEAHTNERRDPRPARPCTARLLARPSC
jgi:hypothetical protein